MAAPTDLTWQQLNDAFGQTIIAQLRPNEEGESVENVLAIKIPVLLNDQQINTSDSQGVIKALAKLIEIARIAQETLNTGKPAGERLVAFPAPVVGGASNGSVPITRSIASRAVLSSVTQIDGATA